MPPAVRRGPGLSAEDELKDLQKRFHLLEGDRKAYYETSQWTIRQNKDTVASLRQENKDLRSALAQLQKSQAADVAHGRVAATVNDISKLEDQVNELRRKYDTMRQDSARKQAKLQLSQDGLKDLERESIKPNTEDSPLTRQIRTLENRLDKAMIKYNEAQSIRKTYEQIVKRLKEERIGFDNQLAAIERTLKLKEHDYEELLLMSHDANHAKEVAKAELAKFEQTVAEERKIREKELAEKRAMVQAQVDMNQRIEKREKMRREIQMEAAGDLSEEAEKNLKKTSVMHVLSGAIAEKTEERDQEKIQTYEEAFRKIKDATGVSDVNEVIQKFLTQEDTLNNLMAMTKEAQARIDQLNDEKNIAKQRVEELKYSGSGSVGSRRVVDEFETHLAEANAKCERNKQKFERVAKILINVKAGVEHLADKVEHIKIDEAPISMSDETVAEVLAQCERKLVKTVDSINWEMEMDYHSKLQSAGVGHEDAQVSQHNMRIKIPTADDHEQSDDEPDDEENEEVPDREHMKRIAALMLEKATKKTRRKGRRKMADSGGGRSGSARGTASKGRRAKDYD